MPPTAHPFGGLVYRQTLELLKLPTTTGPSTWWLTEFEDNWPYDKAPCDLYFSRDSNQRTLKRDPIVAQATYPWSGDVTLFAVAAVVVGPPLLRRIRRGGRFDLVALSSSPT